MPLEMLVDLKRSADLLGISVDQYIRDLIRSRSIKELSGGSDPSEPPFLMPFSGARRIKDAS